MPINMDNIQEICDKLKEILRLFNNKVSNEICFENYEKVFNLSENDLKIYEIIESNLNQLKQNHSLDEEVKRVLKSIDLMIKSIILLNNLNDSELMSTQNLLTIKLIVIKLISITIIPYISEHFQQIQHLFLSIDSKYLPHFDQQFINCQFIHNLTQILISFLNSKSIISRILTEDCLASLLAALMTVRHDTQSQDERQSIDEQMSQLVTQFDQTLIIRNLLLLSNCKAIKWSNNEISKCLSQCFTQNCGLICLINAVLDCDQTSQRQTTLNQRFQAIGTIVSAMPQLWCSLRQYYELISEQVLDLLMDSNQNYHKIGSMIVLSLENRNQRLTQELVINRVLDVFLKPNTNNLTINKAIEIIYNLIVGRFDAKRFIAIISHLFYCRTLLEESVSHFKTSLNVIIIEILNSFKQSVYLLDNILYNNLKLINNFELNISNDVIGVKYKDSSNQLMDISSEKQDLNLKQIDSIVQIVVQLLDKLSESFKIEFFLLLIEKMTFNEPSLMTCSIVDSIHESVSQIITNYSEMSIKFVINTFERMAEQQNQSIHGSNNEEDIDFDEMKRNSLIICIQIIRILLKESAKLSDSDKNQIKESIHSLDMLLKNDFVDENCRKAINELKIRINLLENNSNIISNESQMQNEFESAMAELNDPLMPVRAHALIRLKKLIFAKDKHLLDNRSQLMNALKMCLNDSESYIYLSSINTLSALAILCTEDVLSILTDEFNDNERPIEERLKVGEVLVRLSKSIGEFGHYYSKPVIHCFLLGVKSPEPAIRISSLSNLGQFCSGLRFALKPHIVELISCVESVLKSNDNLEVKRSSVMFLHMMLKGIDRDVIEVISHQMKAINECLRQTYCTTIDDILQLHCQLAIDEINRIGKQLLFCENN